MQEVQPFFSPDHCHYRLAAIDIDDTLVGPDKLVSQANRRAVARLRAIGMRVILASGRTHDNMLPFHRLLGLDDYVVSANGALVKHADTEEVLYERSIPHDVAQAVIAEGLRRDMTVFCFGHDGVYVQRVDNWTYGYQLEANAIGLQVADLAAAVPEANLLKITWATDPERVDSLFKEATNHYADRLQTCITSPQYLEFTAPGADKAHGVAAVAARYGLKSTDVMAFGDGNNDVGMLGWAGLGVAMRDGRPAAHAAADRVSPPGDPETALARSISILLHGRENPARIAEVA